MRVQKYGDFSEYANIYGTFFEKERFLPMFFAHNNNNV